MYRKLIVVFPLLFFFLLFGVSAQAQAQAEKTPKEIEVEETPKEVEVNEANVISGGIGYGVETGILGLQYRRLLSPNWYIQGSLVLDLPGSGWGLGAGYQTDPKDSKCFWFIDCQKRFRFSVSSLQYKGGNIDLSKEGETECEEEGCFSFGGSEGATYESSSSQALSATMAWQDEFASIFFYELQLGYWSMIKKPTFEYKRGPQTSEDEKSLSRIVNSHLAFGLNLGYYF